MMAKAKTGELELLSQSRGPHRVPMMRACFLAGAIACPRTRRQSGWQRICRYRAILSGIMYVLSSKLPVAPDDGRAVVGRAASRDGAAAIGWRTHRNPGYLALRQEPFDRPIPRGRGD
jgi:hypothetical protein